MPWELPPHFSPRWSDTGPNLGHCFDPLLNAEVIAFSFLWFMRRPLRKRPKCQEKCWFDTLQRSFFHAHTSGWIIRNGVLPESCCAKLCCIYLFGHYLDSSVQVFHLKKDVLWCFQRKEINCVAIWRNISIRFYTIVKIVHFAQPLCAIWQKISMHYKLSGNAELSSASCVGIKM